MSTVCVLIQLNIDVAKLFLLLKIAILNIDAAVLVHYYIFALLLRYML